MANEKTECVVGSARRHWIGFAICPLLLAISLPSCAKSRVAPQGENGEVMASYSGSTLEANLPSSVDVLAVQAAAESELRSRGYVITKAHGTADSMRVVARAGGQRRDDEVTVSARARGRATSVSVENGLFGDEAASRVVLDGVLKRLGR